MRRVLLYFCVAVGLTAYITANADKIVFETNRDGDEEIYIMKTDGSGQTNLTNAHEDSEDEAIIDEWPSICPNGRKIIFDRHVGRETPEHTDIFMMDGDGGTQTNLTNTSSVDEENGDCGAPSDSNTQVVVFSKSSGSGNPDIYRLDIDGTDLQQLTTHSATDFEPAWCGAEGKYIVFTSFRDGNYEIYIMEADGDAETRLTNNSYVDQYPSCSPDGKHVAFAAFGGGDGDILKMEIATLIQTNLTPIQNGNVDTMPSWSPGGTQITFSSNRNGNFEVYTMNDDGTVPARLTNDSSGISDLSPDWGEVIQP